MASVNLPPKEYWDDNNWANEHLGEISQSYPNQWVAIVDKTVVAAGKNLSEVKKTAKVKTGRKEFPIVFAERSIHVYQS